MCKHACFNLSKLNADSTFMHISRCIHQGIYKCIHSCRYLYVECMCICKYITIYIYIWVWRDVDAWIHGTSVHACTCHSQVCSIYVNKFIYIYIYIHK